MFTVTLIDGMVTVEENHVTIWQKHFNRKDGTAFKWFQFWTSCYDAMGMLANDSGVIE